VGCGVSGWSGTTISGFPISTLTVEDFVVGGSPNGSLFSLWICDVILPVEWIQFEAQLNERGHAELQWNTASEINSANFSVERSQNGTDWNPIHKLDAAGNASTESHYAYVDEHAPAGKVYYRIRETSQDGSTSESEIVSLWVDHSDLLILYPNPAKDLIAIEGEFSHDVVVTLINQLGETTLLPASWQLDGLELVTADLPRGVYCIQVTDGEKTLTDKLILH
jgi:hypothetical protein